MPRALILYVTTDYLTLPPSADSQRPCLDHSRPLLSRSAQAADPLPAVGSSWFGALLRGGGGGDKRTPVGAPAPLGPVMARRSGRATLSCVVVFPLSLSLSRRCSLSRSLSPSLALSRFSTLWIGSTLMQFTDSLCCGLPATAEGKRILGFQWNSCDSSTHSLHSSMLCWNGSANSDYPVSGATNDRESITSVFAANLVPFRNMSPISQNAST